MSDRPILHFGRDRRFGVAGDPWGLRPEQRDEYCLMVAGLRRNESKAIRYFLSQLDSVIPEDVAVTVVPGCRQGTANAGLVALGRALASKRVDAVSCLVRTQSVPSVRQAVERDLSLHSASIAVEDPAVVGGRAVLLLDDLAVTGHSLRACEEALYDAGARIVQCVVLARSDLALVHSKAKAAEPKPSYKRSGKDEVREPLMRPTHVPAGPLQSLKPGPPPRRPIPAPKPLPTTRQPSYSSEPDPFPQRPRFMNPQGTHNADEHEPSVVERIRMSQPAGSSVKGGPHHRYERVRGQPEGAGPDYALKRQTTRPLIVDDAPGPEYRKLLKRYGAIGDVD